jgi:hypothetical protein
MTPTTELRSKLRKLINEQIPSGGTETDSKFLDSDLDDLLTESTTIYAAAATGWTMKAGMFQSQIESYTVGQEKYDLTSVKDQYTQALAMAKQYTEMAQAKNPTGSGVILKIKPPEVL